MNALDLLFELGDACLDNPKIYLQAGHNGPYHHPETPVRNRGHWLITFSRLYEWSGNDKYLQVVEELAGVFLESQYRPHGYSFLHRNAKGKDQCNGLMGQAWSIEALASASSTLNDSQYFDIALDVFLQHPFNESLGLWNILEVDGKIAPIDNAFNHQLWFAAAASLLMNRDSTVDERISIFLEKIWENVTVLENGLIYHELEHIATDQFCAVVEYNNIFNIRQFTSNILQKLNLKEKPLAPEERKKLQWEKMYHKSVGYHSFNTYAFGLLKNTIGDHPIWENDKFLQIIRFLSTRDYSKGIENNKYSYAYNPPGYEVPYSLATFEGITESGIQCSQLFLQQQLDYCYNPMNKLMDKNNEDPFTLTARIYELSRLSSDFLKKVIIKV